MRVYDDRFARDQRKHELAVRLLRLEARNHTVQRYTGLREARVRSLWKAYCEGENESPGPRLRGPSPYRVDIILQPAGMKAEAAALVGICQALGIVQKAERSRSSSALDLTIGEHLCDAYELYRETVTSPRISLEQLLCLLAAVRQGEELAVERCRHCEAFILIDPFGLAARACAACAADGSVQAPHTRVAESADASDEAQPAQASDSPLSGIQQTLF